MGITTRIRFELLRGGAMSAAELARRCDRERSDLHPYLNQLQRAKKDPVVKVSRGYALKRAHCYLAQVWG